MLAQRTIKNIISTSGVGLHAGGKVNITFKPAPINTGIVFVRTDISAVEFIKLTPQAVVNTRMATVISNGTSSISTVEHVLSACCGLAIDNLYIEIDGAEIPIMDGSSAPFVYLLQSAKIITQNVAKKWLVIKDTIKISDGDKWAELNPYNGFKLDFTIDFKHPALNKTPKNIVIDFGKDSYIQTISKARTFGFSHEIEALRQAGLARGGSIDNVIVMDEYRILNNDSMRYSDEFVRHKVLDAIGDLYMAGYPILGYYKAFKSGHAVNNMLLREVFAKNAFEILEITEDVNDLKIQKWLDEAITI
jgi:UDP-3-O-[3-hydroxymyristoyl] N-acetylglucosamine deacetylase